MAGGPYKMGTIARLSGFSPDVLRVWERRHRLLSPERGPGGQRLYTDADLATLRRVKAQLEAGRTIGEIVAADRSVTARGGVPAGDDPITAWRAGVPMVFGTDAAVYPHGLNARQFRIMVERGMPPMEAIKSATSRAAHHLGWGGHMGRLAAGYFGDLIAVRGDPLADITELERVEVVIKGGLPFKLPECQCDAQDTEPE